MVIYSILRKLKMTNFFIFIFFSNLFLLASLQDLDAVFKEREKVTKVFSNLVLQKSNYYSSKTDDEYKKKTTYKVITL